MPPLPLTFAIAATAAVAAPTTGDFPRAGFLKRWRKAVWDHLKKECRRSSPTLLCDGDIYQFGVFTGRSLMPIARLAQRPPFNTSRVRLWGFDSFVGLPKDGPVADAEGFVSRSFHRERYVDMVLGQNRSRADEYIPFGAGRFSAAKAAGVDTPDEAAAVVHRYVTQGLPEPKCVNLIVGFLNQSLTPSLASERGMRPATYVDIDVDIYKATFEALDWMMRSGLIGNGTTIGYDDFNAGIPRHGYPAHRNLRWETVKANSRLEGEPRAHREIAAKYGLKMEQVSSVPNHGGQTGFAFTVRL